MGGSGSGSYYRSGIKDTTDGHKSLDVNWLNRKGYLAPGRWSSIHWWRGDEDVGNINIRAEERSLVLEYRCGVGGGEWESVTEAVLLSWTLCNYGGRRPWFICPGVRSGVPCRRRVAKLYGAGKLFLCRHCYDLAYDSQREPKYSRLTRVEQNIRRRLGGSTSLAEPFPPKPKGMHWNTYLRLRNKAEYAELRYWGLLAGWLRTHTT